MLQAICIHSTHIWKHIFNEISVNMTAFPADECNKTRKRTTCNQRAVNGDWRHVSNFPGLIEHAGVSTLTSLYRKADDIANDEEFLRGFIDLCDTTLNWRMADSSDVPVMKQKCNPCTLAYACTALGSCLICSSRIAESLRVASMLHTVHIISI